MNQLAVCLKELPNTDLRGALEEALDIARRLDCLVELSIRGGTLILHADTPLEDAQRAYDEAVAEAIKREAEVAAKRKAKPKAKAAPKPSEAAPKPAEPKKP